MRPGTVANRLLMAGIAFLAMPAVARAQGEGAVTIRAARRDTVRAEAGTAITAVFALRNSGADSLSVTPRLIAPRGWRPVAGAAVVTLPPRSSDTWLAGVAVPGTVVAGRYVVRGELSSGAADSIVIEVVPRREIEVVNLDTPGWVMSGIGYEARFLVRNAGNVRAAVTIAPSAGRTQVIVDHPTLDLAAGASAIVTVRATNAIELNRSADDVIQVVAVDRDAPEVQARASALTTIVPRSPGSSDYALMPTVLALRTGGGASGVAPLVFAGAGLLADRRTAVDFLVQAPTDQNSPFGFGERDEYRLNVRGAGYAARAGDNVYGLSPLVSTGMMGMGAEYRRTRGDMELGGFAQQLRWSPDKPLEQGAFATWGRDTLRRYSAGLLLRQARGTFSAAVAHGGAVRALPWGIRAEAELAMSDSGSNVGLAWRGRLSGQAREVTYDFSTFAGTDAFAGPARGTMATNAVVSRHLTRDLDLTASASSRGWSSTVSAQSRTGQQLSTATITANWRGFGSLEYGWLARKDQGFFNDVNGRQHGLRLTTGQSIGAVSGTVSIERGVSRDHPESLDAAYALVSGSVRIGLGRVGAIGLSGSRGQGRSLTGAGTEMVSAGANASLLLPGGVQFAVVMSAQRALFGMLDTSGAWFSVTDARLERRFKNDIDVGLHARLLQNPTSLGERDSRAIYLEVRSPLRLPVGRSRERGRAEGRVMDADRNLPVPGVLVRVGDQAAVSDREGRVRFAGLESSVHRVAVDPSVASAGAMLIGDVLLDMRGETALPSQFAVGVTRGARVVALVQRAEGIVTEPQQGGPAGDAPEMRPLDGVLVALESPTDTLYQVTDARGVADFGTVAPGTWGVAVRRATEEAWMEFERGRFDVTVAAGERKDVEFRLMPVQRRVKLMDGGGAPTLRAKPQPKPKKD